MEAEILRLIPYIVINKDYTVIEASEKAYELLNIKKSLLINNSIISFIKEESVEDFKKNTGNNFFNDKCEISLKNNKFLKLDIIHKSDNKIIVFEDITLLKQRENENVRVNSLLENVFNLSSEALRIIDTESNIIKVNNAYLKLHNLSEDDIIEKKCSDILCFDFCNTDTCNLRKIIKQNSVADREVSLVVNNEKKYFILTAKPYEVNGEILGVVESLKDITLTKTASEAILRQKQQIELIINNIPSFISYIDRNQKYVFVNKQYANAFLIEQKDIIGKYVKDIHPVDYTIINQYIDDVLNGVQSIYKAEFVIPAYGKRWLEVTYAPDIDVNNDIRGFFVLTHDITDLKMSEKELIKSKEKYKLIANNTHDVIWTLNEFGKFIFISPSIEKIRGFKVEEALNQTLEEALSPKSYEIAKKEFDSTLHRINNGETKIETKRFLMEQPHKNGHYINMEIIVETIFDSFGKFQYFIGVSRDISYRLDEKPYLQQIDYEKILKNLNCGFALLDLKNSENAYFVEVNTEFEKITEKDKSQLLNLKGRDIFHDIDISAFSNFAENIDLNKTLSVDYFYKPLQKHLDLFLFTPQTNKVAVIVRDITNLRNEELQLKKKEEKYKYIHKNLDDILHVFDKDGNLTFITGSYEKLFNLKENQIIGKNLFELLDKFIDNEDVRNYLKTVDKKCDNQKWNYTLLINGEKKFFETSVKCIFDQSNNLIGSSGITKDITESKRAFEMLKTSEENLKKTQEVLQEISTYTSDFYGKADADGKIIYVSPSVQNVLGYKPDMMLGKNLFDFILPEELSKAIVNKKDFIAGLKGKTTNYRTQRADGKFIWLEVNANSLFDENNKLIGLIASYRDITERIEYQKILEEKEEKYKLISENVLDVIYSIDENMKYNYLAGDIEKILGFDSDFFLGKNQDEFSTALQIPQEEIEKNKKRLTYLVKDKIDKFFYDTKIIRKNEPAYIENKGKIFYNENGQIFKISGIIRDITARKLNEFKINRLSLAVRQSPSSVLITDTDGNILFVNQKFCEITGYEREEVLNNHSRILKSGKNSEEIYQNLWETITSGRVWQHEIINKKKNGDLFYENVYIYPLKDENDKITNYIGLKEDITKRKQIEEILKKEHEIQKKTLENLKTINSEIEIQKEKLQELNATKDKFLSIIGHDLKNPIGSLYNFSMLLINHFNEYDNEKKLYFIKILNDASKSTLDLIENLLTWARSQTGKISFIKERTNVTSLINDVVLEFKVITEKKNIEIKNFIKEDFFANVDKNMFTSIIRNLISNSVKYSNKESSVQIILDIYDELFSISVIDEGIGIEDIELEQLFKIDKTFSSPGTENEQGTGLGLLLCKEFVDKHNGKIKVESAIGKGSKFSFTIPIS